MADRLRLASSRDLVLLSIWDNASKPDYAESSDISAQNMASNVTDVGWPAYRCVPQHHRQQFSAED